MPDTALQTTGGAHVTIDPATVTAMREGEEEETTVVELQDGTTHTLNGTELEVAAALGLNPLDYVAPEDDDASIEDLVERGGEAD